MRIFTTHLCLFNRPLWLSPRQVMLVPINPSCEDYANKVRVLFPKIDTAVSLKGVICLYSMLLITLSGIFLCQVCKQFTEAGFMADADLDSGCLLNKKIRNAQLAQYNFILGEEL